MAVTLEISQLKVILMEAAQLGATEALVQAGLTNRYLTQNSAYRMYGRRTVDNWIKEEKITPYKNGDKNSKVQIDRLELEAQVKGTELIVYFKNVA